MSRRTEAPPVAVIVSCLILVLSPCYGFGQSDNTQISGFVRDVSGAVIPRAKVVVRSEGEGAERSAASNELGYYVISSLPPGLYSVAAEFSGFKRHQTLHMKLDPGIAATLDIVLQIGDLDQTVTVVAAASSIQSDSATVGRLIEGKHINQLQLNGRNPVFLALVKPGVSGSLQSGLVFSPTDGNMNINGSRSRENLITFDGAVGSRTRSGGQSIGVADVDAVQEVQVLTANYGAEYGRSSGGQIRIITRSGTRDLHGGVYEYLRNAALDANSWLRNRSNQAGDRPCSQYSKDSHCRPDPFRYNQFGYNLSGPVALPFTSYNKDRSKLFWLWAQEWVRYRRTTTVSNTVPSLKMRQGDFSELLNPANRFFGRVRLALDPKTRQPYPNNIIPATQLSPNGIGLLRAFPEPTPNYVGPGTANYYQEGADWTDQRKDTLSFDYYPTEKHAIRWRAQLFHYINYLWHWSSTDRVPWGLKRPNQTTSITWTWAISNTLTNEFLASGSRDQVYAYVDTSQGKYRRGHYGINYPYIFPEGKEIPDRIPTVGIPGMVALSGSPYPANSAGPIYDFSNQITRIWRNHAFKAGILFERSGENDNDQLGNNNQNGSFSFVDTRPGGSTLALADAALGLFNNYREYGARAYTPYRGNMLEWFVQDGWKVTPRLRLELGLRHSIIQPYYSLWRNMAVFDANSYNPKIAVTQNPGSGYIIGGDLKSRYNGMALPGDGWPEAAKGRIPIAATGEYDFLFRGLPKQYSRIHKSDFQPRLGIAFSIDSRTVIRSGVGRYFNRFGVSDFVFLGANPPFQPLAVISYGLVDQPAGGTTLAIPLTVGAQDPVYPSPESWVWNVTLERKMPFDTTLQIVYVGRRGLHQQRTRNINQLLPGTLQANPGISADYLRPYKGFGPIRYLTNEASSRYNGLQLEATRRFSRGISFGASYTYSKCQDNGSLHNDNLPNAYDASNMWGPCDYDRRHVLVLYGVFELPRWGAGNVLFRQLLSGWTISFISLMQTGSPFSIETTEDFAGVGTGSGPQLWVVNGDPKLPNDKKKWSETNSDANFWFKIKKDDGSAMFTEPPLGTFNMQSVRNFLTGPGLQNHNLSLAKDFAITEKHKVQFRAEAFNWLNHPNWNFPALNPRITGSFGKVQSKSGERVLQLALRYSF